MLNRKETPDRQPIGHVELIAPEELCFPNGMRVFVFRAEGQALLRAEFIFQNLFPRPESPLRNACLSHMLKEGTASMSSAQIAGEVDFHGAYLLPEYHYDRTALTLYTLTKHLSAVLPIVRDVLGHSVFPETELQTYVRNNKQKLQVSMRKNDYVARKLFHNALFGGTRYGETPTAEAYDAIRRDDLIELYHRQIRPENCTLILSGNVTDTALAQIRELFVLQWENRGGEGFFEPPVLPVFRPEKIVEERSDALQSAIRLGVPCINRSHPDFPALQFANTLFGGYFGSRLMRNIREEKGYTYGIGSALVNLKHGGFFTIASEVGAEATQAALHEIRREMDILRTDLAPEEEVERVKNYMLGAMLGSLESIFSHADKFKAVHFQGLDLSFYGRNNDIVRSMTPERVRQIAETYFDHAEMLEVVVGRI